MPQPIVLYENLRTIVYAPFYLAAARGAWEREGIAIEIRLSPDPVETSEGVIACRADVAWGGPMRVMLHHDRDRDCPLVCFGQVVARDPFILVGHEPNERFRFHDLVGKRVAVADEVPTPWMTFHDDLRRAGIDPDSIDRAPDASMAENLRLLVERQVDVVQVFEPHAARAELDGFGRVWHRFAERGDIAYTTFYTTRRFLAQHREVCAALVRGIRRALEALHTEPADSITAAVARFFPDLPAEVLGRAIAGYRRSGLWARSTALPAPAVVALKAALLSGDLISRDIPYDRIVDDSLCAEARPSRKRNPG